jgi:hypothetical protein
LIGIDDFDEPRRLDEADGDSHNVYNYAKRKTEFKCSQTSQASEVYNNSTILSHPLALITGRHKTLGTSSNMLRKDVPSQDEWAKILLKSYLVFITVTIPNYCNAQNCLTACQVRALLPTIVGFHKPTSAAHIKEIFAAAFERSGLTETECGTGGI